MKCIRFLGALVSCFQLFQGQFKILYPVKKMIKFTETNHKIINDSILCLEQHRTDKRLYHIIHYDHFNLILQNLANNSDFLLLQKL
jgi:hypothetical protein